MKNLILFISISLFIFSCDKVTNPYEHIDAVVVDSCDAVFNDTTYADSSVNIKRILIEDFTGHKCPNCPAGTDIANVVVAKYPNTVLIAAIHNSGSFSEPDPEDGFPANYETVAGEKFMIKFKLGSFPNGLLNRKDFSGGTAISPAVGILQWESTIDNLMGDNTYMTPTFEMKVMSTYNANCRIVTVYPKIKTLSAQPGDYNVVVYILESKIISPQEDNRVNPPVIQDYEHNHMLRAAFPQDGDGKTIFSNPSADEDFIETEGIKYVLPESWVVENCELLVLITSIDTDEIVHIEELHLMEE
tara:strand:- start:7894 stop:8799 length:906 start_codon:yes stop_codon:yes gene_type:complete